MFLALLNVSFCFCAIGKGFEKLNVLVGMDYGSKSHIGFVLEIADVLRDRGHHVSYMGSEDSLVYGSKYNFTKINLGGISASRKNRREVFSKLNSESYDSTNTLGHLAQVIGKTYKKRIDQLGPLFENQSPDVIVCDYFFIPCIDMAVRKNIPIISSQGSVDSPLLHPSPFMTRASDFVPTTTKKMNILQKFNTIVIKRLVGSYKSRKSLKRLNYHRKEAGVPTSKEFFYLKDIFILANSFAGFDVPRPLGPEIVSVGPILDDGKKKLDTKLEKFMSSRKKILYIGFGSVCFLPKSHISNLVYGIVKALKNDVIDGVIWGLGIMEPNDFPDNIVVDGENVNLKSILSGGHEHIKLLEWAPQIPILSHKSVSLFVSHAGLESIFEAMTSGVPVLAMPYFGDQPKNALKLKELGNGDYLNPRTAKPEDVYSKIRDMLINREAVIGLNVQKMQVLAVHNSNRRSYAADLIEQYARYAHICRKLRPEKEKDIPCELLDILPASNTMPYYKVINLDLYTFIVLVSSVTGFLCYKYMYKLKRFSSILPARKIKST